MTLVSTASKGSAASGRVVLFDSTLGANAASIDTGVNGVAPGYNTITVFVLGRTTQAVVVSGCFLRFNGDSGANYDQSFWQWNGAAGSGVNALAQAQISVNFAGASLDANSAGMIECVIPSYDATTFHKEARVDTMGSSGTAANNWRTMHSARWRSTAAINQVAALASSGNLLAGTRLLILGG